MQGSILFNGNIVFEVDFIRKFQARIRASTHERAEVRESKKVLLICGAWADDEYREGHIKDVLRDVGVPSRWVGGFDENIQNLSVYHDFKHFMSQHPEISALYDECLDTIRRVKLFYREKNAALVALLQRHTLLLQGQFSGLKLADVLGYHVHSRQVHLHTLTPRALLFHHAAQELQGTLNALVESDERQARICREVHEYFLRRSGVENLVSYRQMRDALMERILSANSIFLFGGNLEALYYTLRFWQLGDILKTALTLGANFYSTSAGSMILCDKIILYDDFHQDRGMGRRDFEFFDNGLGLVSKIRLFPHCMERVKTDDLDNLTYLAYRFEGSACVGLNQESYLLLETYVKEGRIYERFQSLGDQDGVYVFDPGGQKICHKRGEELLLPGTWGWDHRSV